MDLIDFVFFGTDLVAGAPASALVLRAGAPVPASEIQAGDKLTVNGFSGTVIEVGRQARVGAGYAAREITSTASDELLADLGGE